DRRIAQHGRAAPERAPALGDDAERAVLFLEIAAPVIGIELDLVDVRLEPPLEQAIEMRGLEIGDADGAHEALVDEPRHALERLDVAVMARVRPVDQQEIEIVGLETSKARLAGKPHAVEAMKLL